MSGPVVIPVSHLYVRLLALVTARALACPDCNMLPDGRWCLSHVCLDCGRMAHPHGLGC